MTTKPMVVAIASVSGGGKTTITRELQRSMPNTEALYFDDYDYDVASGILDLCQWVEDGADYGLWNLQSLANEVHELFSKIDPPNDFIILDYPFAYKQKQLGKLIDYAIFIDTPLDIAMARRILRDFPRDSPVTIHEDMNGYLTRGRSAYLHMLDTIKPDSDFVVDGSLPIETIVDILQNKLNAVQATREQRKVGSETQCDSEPFTAS